MYYAPQILLCCLVWIRTFKCSVAKEPLDPELLRKFTKEVETVLSPTLIEELHGAQSNRSAINVAQTVPRNPDQPRSIDNRKSEIQFDENVHPYHYERSYHYHYPPNPQDGSSGPATYSESFYEPRFGPRSQPIDSRDPSHYRSELYNPFNGNSFRNFDAHGRLITNDQRRKDDPGAEGQGIHSPDGRSPSEVLDSSTPVSSPFVPPHPNPFPNTDYDGYRHGVFAGSVGTSNHHFRPTGSEAQHESELHNRYLPQSEGSFSESFHRRPVESLRNFSPLETHGYNEHHTLLPENSPHKSQYLTPPFLGSSFPHQGYQNHFQNNYHPSDAFNSLFSENFTRDFPPRPSFGGFYPSRNYLASPTSPSLFPSTSPTLPAPSKSENSSPPGGPLNQPISTTKPSEQGPVPLASNINSETKLFFPAKDDANYNLQPDSPTKFPFKNFK